MCPYCSNYYYGGESIFFEPPKKRQSACYLIEDGTEKHLFTGDTLFAGSIGRTDFPTGDLSAMRKSLQMLLGTFTDIPVYSGHGDETTLDTERKTNPFLADI